MMFGTILSHSVSLLVSLVLSAYRYLVLLVVLALGVDIGMAVRADDGNKTKYISASYDAHHWNPDSLCVEHMRLQPDQMKAAAIALNRKENQNKFFPFSIAEKQCIWLYKQTFLALYNALEVYYTQ